MEKPSSSTPTNEEVKEPENLIGKSRSIYTIDDMKILTKSFAKTQHPSKQRIEKLAKKLDKTPIQVKTWFTRQRTKVLKQQHPNGLTIKREREESPERAENSSVLDQILTSYDEEKTQHVAKKICRRSLPAGLIKQEPEPKIIVSHHENDAPTVKNISEGDEGFYLDPEESRKLFLEIWKTEKKLSKEALEYYAKRSRKTIGAVRAWFYNKTNGKKICRKSLPADFIKKEPELEASHHENFVQSVKNISEKDAGFYLDHIESKKLFREIWKTEKKLPKEAIEFLAKRSRKTVFAVTSFFNDETKRNAKKTSKRSLPAPIKNKDHELEEKTFEDEIKDSVQNESQCEESFQNDKNAGENIEPSWFDILPTVNNISEKDAGFYLDHEESKKLFHEIWKTERMPPKEALEYLSKRSSKTIGAVRLCFNRETKKVIVLIFFNLTYFI